MYNKLNIGAILMLLHVITGCIINSSYRILSKSFPQEYVQNMINISILLIILPLIFYMKNFSSKNLHLHIIRALCYLISQNILCFLYNKIPFIQVISISITYPIFGSIASIILLKDKASKLQITSLIIGVIGTLIIVKPFSIHFQFESLLTFVAIFMWIIFDIITKKNSADKEPFIIQLFFILLIYSILSIIIYFLYDFSSIQATSRDLSKFFLLGIIMIIYLHTALSTIFYSNSITTVVPVYMFSFVLGALVSKYIFNETLDSNIKYGMILILISNIICIVKKQ